MKYTNPWGEHVYLEEIELREDGGTPAFLQTIKTALCIRLKEAMGVDRMWAREQELLARIWPRLDAIEGLHILAPTHRERLGVISFFIEDLHYNLGVQILNDRFGIQTRGGCSCAGTYGHFLLHVDQSRSHKILDEINAHNLLAKPGWIRMSIHPVMSDAEVDFLCDSVEALAVQHESWGKDYLYDPATNEFRHRSGVDPSAGLVESWYQKPLF